jgi:putative CocE/NonD family hydrolase
VATVRTEFPNEIHSFDTWIPLSDGCCLSARVWLPVDAEERPVPAVYEYIPYRKNDCMAVTESIRHPYCAGFGYASVRVEIRGSGDSEGILRDEYLKLEQDDALEVIEWLAAQPWCTGKVGVIGLSWGGFHGLQVAGRQPPALGAVVTIGTTDDRYNDDVHYKGGCLVEHNAGWASVMLAYNARPPDPATVGERWRELWFERMAESPAFIEEWLSHQRYDDYWKHGSAKEFYDRIQVPVFVVSGWADFYKNPVLGLLEGLSVPRKGLIGAWAHDYPDDGWPEPTIGFLAECVRFWDRWLKGIENGVEDDPMLVFWMPDPPLGPGLHARLPGHWAAEPFWPSPNVTTQAWYLGAGGLAPEPGGEAERRIRAETTAGVDANAAIPTVDQRHEDGLWLCFDSEPLEERIEVFGMPYVELSLASDRPLALAAVRLCDVDEDGISTLLTRGELNLTHRNGHEHPEPLAPGERVSARIRLDLFARVLLPGHRLRVAISPACWPRLWPSPEPVTLTLFAGARSWLELPVRSPRAEDGELREYGPPERFAPVENEPLHAGNAMGTADVAGTTVTRDLGSGRVEVSSTQGQGWRFADGLVYDHTWTQSSSIVEGQPLSAEQRAEHTIRIGRGDWQTRIETLSTLTSDAESFLVTSVVEGYEDGVRVFSKTATKTIRRDLV